MNEDDTEELIGVIVPTVAVLCQAKERKERTKSKVGNKSWWIEGYNNWDDSEFKKHFRVSRETFEYIVNIIRQDIQKQPTNLNHFPMTPKHQLAITLYRLAPSALTDSTVEDLFGVSESLA